MDAMRQKMRERAEAQARQRAIDNAVEKVAADRGAAAQRKAYVKERVRLAAEKGKMQARGPAKPTGARGNAMSFLAGLDKGAGQVQGLASGYNRRMEGKIDMSGFSALQGMHTKKGKKKSGNIMDELM